MKKEELKQICEYFTDVKKFEMEGLVVVSSIERQVELVLRRVDQSILAVLAKRQHNNVWLIEEISKEQR